MNNINKKTDYSAGLVSQSFWFVEFKKFIQMILEGLSEDEIRTRVITENFFGTPNEYRAKRMYGYIKTRVQKMDETEIKLFASSDLSTQKIINLICIIRQDRLFFEFINEVYREKIILGSESIDVQDARVFFKNKEIQRDEIAKWTDGTKKRLWSCYFNFLTDANLITVIDKTKKITPPLLDIVLERYLEAKGEEAYIKALTGGY